MSQLSSKRYLTGGTYKAIPANEVLYPKKGKKYGPYQTAEHIVDYLEARRICRNLIRAGAHAYYQRPKPGEVAYKIYISN